MRLARGLMRPARYLWAAPTTTVGLLAGGLAVVSGGRVQRRLGALEFHGGFATWFMMRVAKASAMTLGHVILGRDAWCLDRFRRHEQAHVRQCEVWGIAFIPAYLACSAWEWLHRAQGRDFYRDNWFERDARRACGEE